MPITVDELLARAEIWDVMNRYARGADRSDFALIRSCYHDDAYDDHGLYKGGMEGLMAFLRTVADQFLCTTHMLGNHMVEIDGDTARAETYALVWYRRLDRNGAERSIAQTVRYLDRFERRAGRWAIAHRRVVLDWEHVFAAGSTSNPAEAWLRGAKGSADPSAGHVG